MTPDARHIRDHELMVQFFYDDLMKDDYFARKGRQSPVRLGLQTIYETALRAVRAGPVEREKAYCKLEGMQVAAGMNNGTPRTQAVLNLIENFMSIAWCSRGEAWGTPEMRERYDYLRKVERLGAFFIPDVKPAARQEGVLIRVERDFFIQGDTSQWIPVSFDIDDRCKVGDRVSYRTQQNQSGVTLAIDIRPHP